VHGCEWQRGCSVASRFRVYFLLEFERVTYLATRPGGGRQNCQRWAGADVLLRCWLGFFFY